MPPPGCNQISPNAEASAYAVRLVEPASKDSAQATVGLPLAAKAWTPSRSSCIVAHGSAPPTLAIRPTTRRSSPASCRALRVGRI